MDIRNSILNASDLAQEELYVEEWKVKIYVREMTEGERYWLASYVTTSNKQGKTPQDLDAEIVMRCVIDEDGSQIFKKSDLNALRKKSARVLSNISNICVRLSRLEDDMPEDAKKNLKSDSSSDSPSPSE